MKNRKRKRNKKIKRMSAAQRKLQRDVKRDLILRGLCRQCRKKRGDSPSKSRCTRCITKARLGMRSANAYRPYHAGGPGRKPLEMRRPRMVPMGTSIPGTTLLVPATTSAIAIPMKETN